MNDVVIVAIIGVVGTILAEIVRRDWNKKVKQMQAEAERIKSDREREESRRATEDARWARLDADVKRLEAKVNQLQQENESLRRENATARAENLEARDQIRDQEELIEDLLTYLIVREDWEDAGATPPPPSLTWRVLAAMRRRREAMAYPIPLASDAKPPAPHITGQEIPPPSDETTT